MKLRSKVAAGAVAVGALAVSMFSTGAASATTGVYFTQSNNANMVCEDSTYDYSSGLSGDDLYCLYYNSYGEGSEFKATRSISDLDGYRFYPAWAGGGQAVKNNAASVINVSDTQLGIFYNHGYSGPVNWVQPTWRQNSQGYNFTSTLKNNEASVCIYHSNGPYDYWC